MHVARFASALLLVATLSAASAVAAAPNAASAVAAVPQADDVIVTTAHWLVSANTPGYTLRFTRDGSASYDGHLRGYDGHYIAKADFVAVEAEVEHAKLCERNGIPLFVPAALNLRMASPTVLVRVRCGDQVKTFNDVALTELPAFAEALIALGKDLAWQRTGPAQRESIVRFIH
jgi:hypothetical protein